MFSDTLYKIESDMKYIPTVVGKMSNADVSILLENIQKNLADVSDESKTASQAVYRIACGTDKATQATLLYVIAMVRDSCISGDAADAKVLKSAILLLSFILSNFSLSSASRGQLNRLIQVVWSTFLVLYRYDKSKEAQGECLGVLRQLLRANDAQAVLSATDFQSAEVIDKCIEICGRPLSSGQRLKSVALQLMGVLAKTYPADVVQLESRMFECFMTVAKRLTTEDQAAQSVGEGFFIGLKNFLVSFPRNFDDVSQQKYIVLVHQMVKNALLLAESSSNYRFCKAALLFLRVHADSTLAECILEDADSYFSILKRLWVHKNTDVHRECYPAAASFFRSLSRQLSAEKPSAHQERICPRELLSRLLEDLKATLQSKEGGHGQITFALVAFGYMARPIHVWFGTSAIYAYFTEISGRSDAIHSAAMAREQGGEDFARVVPQLLTAFACFLLEIGSIDQVGVEAIRALLETTLVLYPHDFYFDRLRVVTVPSLLKLFVALSHHQCRTELMMFFCRRTLQLLAPLRVTVSNPAESEAHVDEPRDGEEEKVALYAQLWSRLLQSDSFLTTEETWAYPWDTADCGAALRLLRAGMQSVAIEVVAHANLAVVSKTKGRCVSLQEVTNRSLDVQPRVPEEYGYFLSFVSFQAAILPALWRVCRSVPHNEEEEDAAHDHSADDTAQLIQWTTRLMEASQRYPHVSGLFQLLSATLWETPSAQLLGAAQRAECQAYAASCLYRSHIYTDELLYRCAVLVIVLSDKLALKDESCAQLARLFQTVVAADGGMLVSRLHEVERNVEIALDVLRRWIKTKPSLAARILLQLLSGKAVMHGGAQAQLCTMAAECGMLMANQIEGGEDVRASAPSSFSLRGDGSARVGQPQWKVQGSVLPLSLPPMKVDFPVYGLLPRVVELCFHGDRMTATTAAELFHFLVVWTVGNDKDTEAEWYNDMFPAVIRLAAGAEKSVTQELFHDLLFMCARWFSAKPNADGFTRSLLLLLESEDASLRLTATEGLLEYIRAAEKNQNKEQRDAAIAQVMSVLRAKLLADAPWPRLGAAGVLQQLLKAVLDEHLGHYISHIPRCLCSVMTSLQKTAVEMMHDELGIIAELTGCVHVMETVVNSTVSTGSRRIQALLRDLPEQDNTRQLLTETARAAVAVAPHYPETTRTLIRLVGSINNLPCSKAAEADHVSQEWIAVLHNILNDAATAGTRSPDSVDVAIASAVLYTALRQDAETHQGVGTKRSCDGQGSDKLASLLQDTLSNVSKAMNDIAREKEGSPLNATQRHFCEVLSTFLSTYTFSDSIRDTRLDIHQLSGLAQRLLASPVQGSTRGEDANGALARCVCSLLWSLSNEESKAYMHDFIGSMKLLVPSYLLQSSSASGVLCAYRSRPHDVCRELDVLCHLTRFSARPSAPSVWFDVIGASGAAAHVSAVLCQVVGSLLQQSDLGHQSNDKKIIVSLLTLLFSLEFTPHTLLDAILTAPVKQMDKKAHRAASPVNVGFFVEQLQEALPTASQSCLFSLLGALSTAVVAHMEEVTTQCLNEEEGAEQKDGGGSVAAIWVAEQDMAAQVLFALLQELKGRPVAVEMGPHLSNCCEVLLPVRASSSPYSPSSRFITVASFKLRALKLLFQVEQSTAYLTKEACARVIDFLRQAASSEHWSGDKYKLLAERPITDMFLRVSEVVCAALGQVGQRDLSENASAIVKASEEIVKYTLDNEMPLDWRELPPETPTSDNYHKVVHAVVAMMRVIVPCDVSSTLMLLPLISMTDFPESDLLSLTVSAALREVDTASLLRLCDETTALQRSHLPRPLWWAATYGILLPLLRSFPEETRVSFFQRNVPLWVEQAEEPVKATCFQQCNALLLLEAAYKLLDQKVLKGPVNDAFLGGGQSGTGKELTVKMIKVCGSARQYDMENKGEEATEFRQVACRCLTAVLMATQDNEAVFVKLLLDSKNTKHWNGIVTAGLTSFPVEVAFPRISEADAKKYSEWELSRRPRVANVKRNRLLDKTLRTGASTVAGSGATTLAFGLDASVRESAPTLLSEGGRAGPSDRPVDIDSIWRSTCSGALFTLLDFLIAKSLQEVPQGGNGSSTNRSSAPAWVQEIVSLLTSEGLQLEVKLVWLKLILLRPSFFRTFAGLFAAPLLTAACDTSLGPHLHYVARELLHTLLDWFADGSLTADSQVANLVMPFLLRTVPNTDSTYVLRHNVELFKKLFAHLKSEKCLSVADLLSLVESRRDNDSQIRAICQMCAAVVDEGAPLASLGAESDVLRLYSALTRLISYAVSNCVLAVSETLAMELRALRVEDKGGLEMELRDKMQVALGSLRNEHFSLLLKVVKTVQMWDTATAAAFLSNRLFANFTGLSPGDQMMVLEILGGAPTEAVAMYDTIVVQFAGALHRYDDGVKVHFLELLAALMPQVQDEAVEQMTVVFLTADTLEMLHTNTDCRVAFFQCCVAALKTYGNQKQKQLVSLIVEKGLQDPFPFIQNIVLEYLDTDYLSADPAQRLRELLRFSPLERSWPRHCAVMLLSLCHSAPDFASNKYFFPNPLSDCEFEEKTLQPSRTLTADTMTPLFSQTGDKALAATTPSAFVFPTASQCYSPEQQTGGRTERVPMAPPRFAAQKGRVLPHSLAPPTQVAQFTSYSMATPPVELHSSLLFSRSDDDGAANQLSMSLSRQLREMPTEVRNLLYMSASAKQKQQRIKREKTKELLRAREEVIFRRYRAGEVPDIQVSLQALVTPLQALCLHDTQLASAVCAPLVMELFRTATRHAARKEDERSMQAASPGVEEQDPLYVALQTFISAATSGVEQAGKSAFQFNMEMLLRFAEVGGKLDQHQFEALLQPCRQGLLSAEDSHEAANATIHVLDILHLEKATRTALPESFVWRPLSDAFELTQDMEKAGETTKHFLERPEVQLLTEVRWRAKTGGLGEGIKRLEQWLRQHAANEGDRRAYAILNRQKGLACASLLQWSDVWDAFCATKENCRLQDISLILPAALRCEPDKAARVLDGYAITRPAISKQYPFEWSILLMNEGSFVECEKFIRDSLSLELLSRHEKNVGGTAFSFVNAYKLYTVLQCAQVLTLVSDERPAAIGMTRQLLTRFAHGTTVRSARLVDDLALVQQSFERILFGPILEQKLPPEYTRDLRDQCQAAEMDFLAEHCNYLLDDAAQNGAVKQLLATAMSFSAGGEDGREDFKVKIKSAVLRANLYRVAAGAQWLRAHPREALETVMEKAERLPPNAQAVVRLDHAVCRLQLDLQQPVVPSRAMDGVLEDLRYLAANGESEESALRLLDVVDRILSLYPEVDRCTVEVEGCWRLFAETFVRCIAQHGLTQPHSKRGQVAPIFCVPHVLQLLDLRHAKAFSLSDDVWENLFAQMAALPSSVWLPWTSQLISALLRTEHRFAAQILYQLAQDYPQSVYYPYRCVKEELDAIYTKAKGDPAEALACALKDIKKTLEENKSLARMRLFADCLPKLHDPDLRFNEMMLSVCKEIRQYEAPGSEARVHYKKAQDLFSQFHAAYLDVNKLDQREVVSLDFADIVAKYITRLCPNGQLLQSSKELTEVAKTMGTELAKRFSPERPLTVEKYSVRLAQLLDGNAGTGTDHLLPLEPPVQPIMWLHPRPATAEYVIGAAPTVKRLLSVQRPKRLVLHTTRCSLVVLVKGGDDLRMDQRVQEFFMLLSRFLVEDGSGHLHLRTYSVVPVSKQMGLVEWVPLTKTLNDVINMGMVRRGIGKETASHLCTIKYKQKYGKVPESYAKSYLDTNDDAATWYKSLVDKIDPLCLTSALHDIAADRCGAYEVRTRFQRTHATLSIASYLFGIGDRHLSNFLVDMRTGDLISIDFGHAFGSATYALLIPELVPFRLTPQIQGALGALGSAVTAAPMSRVLHTLRERRTVVESIASAFAQEPLEHWKREIRPSELADMARTRVDSVRRKLDLERPYYILERNLEKNRRIKDELRDAMKELILNVTRQEADEEEADSQESIFVQSLIKLATSEDILGRFYSGWQPLF